MDAEVVLLSVVVVDVSGWLCKGWYVDGCGWSLMEVDGCEWLGIDGDGSG